MKKGSILKFFRRISHFQEIRLVGARLDHKISWKTDNQKIESIKTFETRPIDFLTFIAVTFAGN